MINTRLDHLSSLSYLIQLVKRVNQFEIRINRAEELRKKMEIAKEMQDKLNMLVDPVHTPV